MQINTLIWILVGGLLMSAIALIGGLTTLLKPARLERLLLPLIALAAGSLLGGAFFHMIPQGTAGLGMLAAGIWLLAGFTTFLGLELFLHWHQSHHARAPVRRPVTTLILIGDAVHNFLGGLGIASTFLINPSAGMVAWIAAAAHEVPQELGDFAILVHGGFARRSALFWNLLSALTFPVGALLALWISQAVDVSGLVLFGAGSFVYIAASDLVPEIKGIHTLRQAGSRFGLFVIGLALTLLLAFALHGPAGGS